MDEAAVTYLAFARKLIEEKRYDDARAVLKMVEHPTAKKWLIQLEKIAPEPTLTKLPSWRRSPSESNPIMSFKVLSQKDKWFSGKFDPLILEEALNSYSGQGWKMRTSATATIPGFGGAREEMIFILERPNSSQQEITLFEYKVLSQKDKWFSGKFDPAVIEQAINAYASQGWRVVNAVTASMPGFGGAREEMIIILERPRAR